LYFLAFTGDFLLSTMIVASTLVGTRLGAPGWEIGLLGSAFYMTYTPSALFLGRLSDRLGRRKCILTCAVGFLGVSFMFMAGSGSIVVVFIGELLVGLLNGFYWSSIEAFISENARTEKEHQANVNKFCLSWSLGYMIGPFIAPVLDDFDPVYSFLILAVLSSINIINGLFFVPKTKTKARASIAAESRPVTDVPRRGVMIIVLILTLAIFTYNFARAFIVGVFPDIAKNPSYFGWSGVETGLVLFCFGAARSATFLIQNRIRNESLSTRAWLSLALSLSAFLFITTKAVAMFCIFFAIVGILSALVYTMVLQKMLHLPSGKGQSAGIFESGLALGGLVSPIFSGLALGTFQVYEAAFILIGIISSLVSLVALLLLRLTKLK
jgi:predicted MFS family arabinose efflux permease